MSLGKGAYLPTVRSYFILESHHYWLRAYWSLDTIIGVYIRCTFSAFQIPLQAGLWLSVAGFRTYYLKCLWKQQQEFSPDFPPTHPPPSFSTEGQIKPRKLSDLQVDSKPSCPPNIKGKSLHLLRQRDAESLWQGWLSLTLLDPGFPPLRGHYSWDQTSWKGISSFKVQQSWDKRRTLLIDLCKELLPSRKGEPRQEGPMMWGCLHH